VVTVLVSLLLTQAPARGWFPAGSQPAAYSMGLDSAGAAGGKSCAVIRSKPDAKIVDDGFGTYMQTATVGGWAGKRVRLTAQVKTRDAVGHAAMWLRFDAGSNAVAFDNMDNRPIVGTTPWASVSIVLDVPRTAETVAFGGLLVGPGTMWFDELKFEVVDSSVPVTATSRKPLGPPVNLGLEEPSDGGS
jgi:hypothetical protein